ncbi:MAG: type B 50S ribosomal protein L31 [Myxococcota bacterium]
MKADIHPAYHPVVFLDDEHEIITRSTLSSSETRTIDGVDHFVIRVDISSYSHPFYTGRQKMVDREGRVERFKKRYAKKKK